MQKSTKGALAAGAAAVLLTGGVGTLAYWSDAETVTGGAINAGHMELTTDGTNTGCDTWKLDDGEDAPGTYADGDPIVPGDVLTKTCTYTLDASGNHLRGTLQLSAPSFGGTDSDFGGMLSADVTGPQVDGVARTSFTEADNGKAVSATITVTFNPAAVNNTQKMTSVLGDLTLTATQIHS